VPGTATYRKAGTYTIAFSVTDKDGATGAATPLTLTVNRIAIGGAVLPATIYVNDRAQGIITFVILGTPTFDPMTVDAATARIGDVGVIRRANGTLFTTREDVNNDGILDFVLRFDKDELVAKRTLASGVSTLSLHADLADGRQMVSTVAVTVRP